MAPGVGELDVYPSIWGHWAGGPPGNMDDVKWLDERLAKIFASAPHRDEVAGVTEGLKKAEL
jgi:homoserine O-acetyltransferase